MAGKFLNFMKNPIAGVMGANSAKGQAAQNATYSQNQPYGGSTGAADDIRQRYQGGQAEGGALVGQGVQSGQNAVSDAQQTNDQVNRGLGRLGNQQGQLAGQANQGFQGTANNFAQDRSLQLHSADQLLNMANGAPSQYMKTDQAQFQANQDQAQRAALSIGAAGGASGVRAALAGSQDANAAAGQQAQIARANEYNALLQNQQNAVGQAAGIQAGVGNQNLGLASQFSNREQQATGQQASALGAQGNLAVNQGQLGLSAANQQVNAGTAQQQGYLGGETSANAAAANVGLQNETNRVASAKESYKNTYRPIMSVLGMGK